LAALGAAGLLEAGAAPPPQAASPNTAAVRMGTNDFKVRTDRLLPRASFRRYLGSYEGAGHAATLPGA